VVDLILIYFDRAAAMTLRTVLLSLQALMAAAEPDDPQDAVVAKQFKEYPEIFAKTASHWTNVYADGIIYLINLHLPNFLGSATLVLDLHLS